MAAPGNTAVDRGNTVWCRGWLPGWEAAPKGAFTKLACCYYLAVPIAIASENHHAKPFFPPIGPYSPADRYSIGQQCVATVRSEQSGRYRSTGGMAGGIWLCCADRAVAGAVGQSQPDRYAWRRAGRLGFSRPHRYRAIRRWALAVRSLRRNGRGRADLRARFGGYEILSGAGHRGGPRVLGARFAATAGDFGHGRRGEQYGWRPSASGSRSAVGATRGNRRTDRIKAGTDA